jgi:DNA-binding NarL/FixJ family response regulator
MISPETHALAKTALPMSRRPRLLLADDHTMLLDAFRRLLEPRCEIVGTASDGHELVDVAATTRPDVIVLDISMPRLNGMDACALLCRKMPELKLIFLTMNEDPDIAAGAIRLGASGYLLKSSASAELFTAIEQALAGKLYITPLLIKGVPVSIFLHQATKPGVEKLTMRQREVLQLLAEGLLMKQIADLLHVTTDTVAFHKYTSCGFGPVGRIFQKKCRFSEAGWGRGANTNFVQINFGLRYAF